MEAEKPAGEPPLLTMHGPVATLTLQRPHLANRLSLADLDILLDLVQQVESNHDLRILRLRSLGKTFCSGFDLSAVGGAAHAAVARFEQLANALAALRPLTVAQVQGGAYGGAVDLTLACDFRIGSKKCEMRVPAASLGLHFYPSGMARAVSRLGLPAARRLLLACDTPRGEELLRMGLLDRTVEPENLDAETQAFCQHLASLAPLAVLPMKQHLNRMAEAAPSAWPASAWAAMRADMAAALNSRDLQEGSLAWQERRPPQFEGH
jgi:enoyl-CoA hydratase/carnithine racemase